MATSEALVLKSALKWFAKLTPAATSVVAIAIGGITAWADLKSDVSQLKAQQAVVVNDHDAITSHTQQLKDIKDQLDRMDSKLDQLKK